MPDRDPVPATGAPRPGALPVTLDGVGLSLHGRALVRGLDLRLAHGPLSVVLGPNGAGKSVLLRLLAGLVRPTEGALRWEGPLGDQARERTSIVRQRPVLLRRSVAANVDYPLRLAKLPRAERDDRARRVLAATGLDGMQRRPARRLSVGEQQRLALARAWVSRPELALLDEPAAPLDPPATRALETAVRRLRDSGTKVVLTTHDLGQARRMADEVVFLSQGRILEQTPADEFFERPRTPEAKAFLQGEILS